MTKIQFNIKGIFSFFMKDGEAFVQVNDREFRVSLYEIRQIAHYKFPLCGPYYQDEHVVNLSKKETLHFRDVSEESTEVIHKIEGHIDSMWALITVNNARLNRRILYKGLFDVFVRRQYTIEEDAPKRVVLNQDIDFCIRTMERLKRRLHEKEIPFDQLSTSYWETGA